MGAEDRYRRTTALSAAAMYCGAAAVGILESLVGDPGNLVPSVAALGVSGLVALAGLRIPMRLLWLFGPLGSVLVAVALSQTGGTGDGAVIYAWPVIWVALFFEWRPVAATVVVTAAAHGYLLTTFPPGLAGLDRFIDVVASSVVIGAVVRALVMRNNAMLKRLSEEARIDALTGLLNRRGFEERYGRAVSRARREGTDLAVIALDLDHFKSLNDRHGHEAGDRVLQRVGSVIVEHVRGVDIAARVGGEEFVLVLPGSGAQTAFDVAERIRAAIADPEDELPLISVSAGVATGGPSEDLVEAADLALYDAKRSGRDRVAVAA